MTERRGEYQQYTAWNSGLEKGVSCMKAFTFEHGQLVADRIRRGLDKHQKPLHGGLSSREGGVDLPRRHHTPSSGEDVTDVGMQTIELLFCWSRHGAQAEEVGYHEGEVS